MTLIKMSSKNYFYSLCLRGRFNRDSNNVWKSNSFEDYSWHLVSSFSLFPFLFLFFFFIFLYNRNEIIGTTICYTWPAIANYDDYSHFYLVNNNIYQALGDTPLLVCIFNFFYIYFVVYIFLFYIDWWNSLVYVNFFFLFLPFVVVCICFMLMQLIYVNLFFNKDLHWPSRAHQELLSES